MSPSNQHDQSAVFYQHFTHRQSTSQHFTRFLPTPIPGLVISMDDDTRFGSFPIKRKNTNPALMSIMLMLPAQIPIFAFSTTILTKFATNGQKLVIFEQPTSRSQT